PVLMLRNCALKDVVPLSQGRHVRFRVCGTENGRSYSFNAVYFGIPFDSFPYSDGDVCDVAFTADMNEYMGMRTPQLFIKAVRVNEAETEEMAVCNKHFRMLSNGEGYENAERDIPDLADFRNVFRYLRREMGTDGKTISLTSAVRTLCDEFEISVTLCKLKIIIEVLQERKLIELKYSADGNSVLIKPIPAAGKTNIDDSPLLRAIRGAVGR
ncbi:MAG: hypothetical protein IKU23_04800, partial [Clostridia bacterium]|nr:hypothetical protein [Clostridia bacterium]